MLDWRFQSKCGLGIGVVAALAMPLGCSSGGGSTGGSSDAGADARDVVDSGSPHDATAGDGSSEHDAGADAHLDATTASDAEAGSPTPSEASADDAEPEAGPAWTPAALQGLVLWLDDSTGLGLSDAGAGDAATTPLLWLDQSGNGNSATSVGSPKIDPTGVGGLPAVQFNGSTDYLSIADSPSLQWGTDDFLLALVFKHTTPLDGGGIPYGTLFSKQSAVYPYSGVGLFANTPIHTTGFYVQIAAQALSQFPTNGTGYNDGVARLVVMQRTAAGDAGAPDAGDASAPPPATLSLTLDQVDAGAITGSGAGIDVTAAGRTATIGGTAALQDLQGEIAEVIAVHGAMSPADLASLQQYLTTKYGL